MFDPRVPIPVNANPQSYARIWCSENVALAYEAHEQGMPLIDKPWRSEDIFQRKPGLQWGWTEYELSEAAKCRESIEYFAEHYCYLLNDEAEYVIVKLYPYQRKILKAFQEHRFLIMLASRQMGKTTTTALCLLWLLIFGQNERIALLGDKEATAIENIDKIKQIYVRLPFFLKPGVQRWNDGAISFDNGNRIFGGPCNRATIVGKTITTLYFDELAIPDEHISRDVVEFAFPTISAMKKSRIVVSSSPRGDNIFKELWLGAISGYNPFHPIRIDWWEKPGRDEKWKQEQIGLLGSERAFQQQYGNVFLSGTGAWLNDEISERIAKQTNAEVWRPIMDFVTDSTFRQMLSIEGIILKSKFRDEQTLVPTTKLASKCWFDKEFFDGKDLRKIPIVCILDTSEGRQNDHTIANLFVPEYDLDVLKKIASDDDADEDDFGGDVDDDEFDTVDDVSDDALAMDYFAMNNVRLRQVGVLDSNEHSVPMVALFLQILFRNVFNQDLCKILCERDGIGSVMQNMLLTDIVKNSALDYEMMAKDGKSLGIYMRGSKKKEHIDIAESIFNEARLIVRHPISAFELGKFGLDGKEYKGIGAHDDHSITFVMAGKYITTEDFFAYITDTVIDTYLPSNASGDGEDDF